MREIYYELKGGENNWRMRSKNVVGYWGEWSELEFFTMVGPNPPDLVLPLECHHEILKNQKQ